LFSYDKAPAWLTAGEPESSFLLENTAAGIGRTMSILSIAPQGGVLAAAAAAER
jgi:hypothetical protein